MFIAMAAAAPISGKGTFVARIMARVACVASSIPRLIAVEVVERLFSAAGHGPTVAVMRIVAVINMAVESARAVEPRTGSNKYSTLIPVGPIVAVGRTIVRSIVEVSVGAPGRRPNVHANGNLGLRTMRTAQQRNGENCESESFTKRHNFSSIQLEPSEEPRVASPEQYSALGVESTPLKMDPPPQSTKTVKNHSIWSN
jgi:hypothetical protein